MKLKNKTELFIEDEFYDIQFIELELDSQQLENKVFEQCTFTKSSFVETLFKNCKFIDCEFNFCNLSSAQFRYTSFNEATFTESKLIGINWTQVKWPLIHLASPLKFYKSNLSHSSFYELPLRELVIEDCKAHDVDFRGCDLSKAVFTLTDFQGSLFLHTKLISTDFKEAIGYSINPLENDIRKAKFSLPDAMNLLNAFEIEILD